MWVAHLICSEESCPDELEVVAETLAELETFSCLCGCAMHVVGFPDHAG
jgi:hypothetical protein